MKICNKCSRQFKPSSRHLTCPGCRKNNKRTLCVDCNADILHGSKRCKKCNSKAQIGIKIGDQYTGLREFVRRAKNRNKFNNLTLDHLLLVWKRQNGCCLYSGVKLLLPKRNQKHDPIYAASLDRIDSLFPYTNGNVQFLSSSMNFMKNNLTNEKTIELCKIIANHWR